MIAEIIPETKTGGNVTTFTYIIPDKFREQIGIGSLVKIPFGRQKIRGVVLNISSLVSKKTEYKVREILSVDENFILPNNYIDIAIWVSKYYLCSLGEAVGMFLPPEMVRPRANAQVKSQKLKVKSQKIVLSEEQETIFQKLKISLAAKDKKPALIFGVTGSGKTEIYLKLAKEILERGEQVIVLVPEIILTPQTVEKFEQTFNDQVCLMHSHLSKSEKYRCYFDFYSGSKRIIVGPRSALLVPNENTGLIIIDEEQEDSFKQEQNPRYHAVELAEKIAKISGALLLLGTATPRIETFYKSKSGKYDLFTLSKRFSKSNMPASQIVDLKDEIKQDNFSPISVILQKEIKNILDNKRQVLLFLNRRGTATFVSCRDCGHVMLCKNCSIPMVYHLNSKESTLVCHHCDYKEQVPIACPSCGGPRIKYFGAGVDKIESEVRKLFPVARIARVDSTTIKSKSDYESFYRRFKEGEIDVVIGTQMIAKGLDIPGVDLVGVISADTGLHMPQYRATERIFQLLTQVSGRSGRRDNEGKTILQTYWPESAAILAASKHDYLTFFDAEVMERRSHFYPPFTHLINVISEQKRETLAAKYIDAVAKDLKDAGINFIGPGDCFYKKMHNKHRKHLIIKADALPDEKISRISADNPNVTFDVDPTNLL